MGAKHIQAVVWGAADTADATPGSGPGDPELISAVRMGSVDAMALLYQRHKGYGLAFALTLVREEREADDVLQDAFSGIFQALTEGLWTSDDFLACLTTAITKTAVEAWRQKTQEVGTEAGGIDPGHGPVFDDEATTGIRSRLLAAEAVEDLRAALAVMPPRWQQVLWYTNVLKQRPRRIAPLMGLSPNAVSALLLRARKSLKSAHVIAEAETWELLSDWHPGP
ncbi:RNA polymerase sigma factor [Arthrobacter bambusae]|uniref:RNA polymerase sigma factor (Sigma-70 family) n=1 Tax=Arthrobacter bambusae TaxID=1338426 RepID=A0AAW8D2I0_9MICC|nr:sigma-70 family RNA polymerase sigma factor [Arthrobacter bambusae]MDP9903101.1 RNA polymerase sigma factor (sigma-70 family) [Arthrobacter bambusae]MDQ0128905.1 RNA polymerase sigma factor (sigma-70 family) [Arthrobacter bambusae]MDQ0180246.1 RNA polymerase sigma factor (sigma-70 family) [Arthrobacter bambusae]